jgi:DNA polymerase III subunit gamma/tau
VTPCGECDSCVAIALANSLDVIEMDAASNNSVDDIRDLRERVAYAPVSGRHKVYILDEAHMLTAAAWNAFLKTLEEPPPNTVFVLATTEANKVLPTVVDRCHRFDFARPSVAQIAAVLRRVADREQIAIPDEASALIARSATGSFRDALGTLEQLLAYSGKSRGEAGDERSEAVSLDDVLAVLGAADAELLFGAIDAVDAGQQREALLAAARLAESGRDIGRFFSDLEAHARALMVVQTLGEVPPELHVTPEQDERLAEQARRVGPAAVVRLLELIAAALRAMKDGADARTQLELALLKAAEPAYDPSVKALLARIERLEGRGSAPAAPHDPAQPATAAGRTKVAVAATTPVPAPAEEPEAAVAVTAVAVVEKDEATGELSLDAFAEVWPAVVSSFEAESPQLYAILQEARPTALTDRDLTIAWPQTASLYKRQAEDPERKEQIARSIREVTGASLRLAYELGGEHTRDEPTFTEEELVDRFKQEFGAVEEPKEES